MSKHGFLRNVITFVFLAISSPVFATNFATPLTLNGYDGEFNHNPSDVFSLPKYSVTDTGYAKLYTWVGSRVLVDQGDADGDLITWNFYDPDGVLAYSYDVPWHEAEQCWYMFAMLNTKCINPGGWIEIAHSVDLQIGNWRIDLLNNGMVTHEIPFTVRGRVLESSSGQNQTVQVMKTTNEPLAVVLHDYDGGPAASRTVKLEVTDRPGGKTSGGLDYFYNDPSTGGTTSSLTVGTDEDGIARVYFGAGENDGDYTITATTETAPEYSVDFVVHVVPVIELPPANDITDILEPSKNRGRPKQCQALVNNPINVINGNKYQVEVDYRGNTPVPLEFVRYYNSQMYVSSSLGIGWRHTYMRSISTAYEDLNGSRTLVASAMRADGKVIKFVLVSRMTWLPMDADNHSVLTQSRDGWVYKENDNETENYDADGRLASIDRKGNLITLDYDPDSGRLTRVTSPTGEYLAFGYYDKGLIHGVGIGHLTPYDYSNYGWWYSYPHAYSEATTSDILTYVRRPDETDRSYHYEDDSHPSNLTGITNENGVRYSTYAYDDKGRAISTYHAGYVNQATINYSQNGARTVTDSKGGSSSYQATAQLGTGLVSNIDGPGCGSCGGSNESFVFDTLTNDLLSKTENGVTTEYGAYDANGNYTYKIVAKGTSGEKRYDYTYDARFMHKVASIREPSVYAGGEKVTTYDYDDYGNVISKNISGYTYDGAPVSQHYRYEYAGPFHQLSLIDGPREDVNDITTFQYYPETEIGPNKGRLLSVTDANNQLVRSNITYTDTGKVASENRANGLYVEYSYYPGNDLLESQTESWIDNLKRITHWTYTSTGKVNSVTYGYSSPEAITLTFEYDDAERLTGISDGLGNKRTFTLDSEGNVIGEKEVNNNGTLTKLITRTFDTYNNLDVVTVGNAVTDFDYQPDGTLSKKVDGNNVVTTYGYDDIKRLTSINQDDGGNDTTTANSQVDYIYNNGDQVTTTTDPKGSVTVSKYDDLGNLLELNSPDAGITTFTYDSAGNRKSKINAQNERADYVYDALDRLVRIDYYGTENDTAYTYDSCPYGYGAVCGVTYGISAESFAYTGFGDLDLQRQFINLTLKNTFSYSYNEAGRIDNLYYPNGVIVLHTYDAAGNVASIFWYNDADGQTNTVVNSITYAPFGKVNSFLYGDGESRQVTYDASGLIDSINDPVFAANYSYDNVGNVLVVGRASGDEHFSYDSLNRLVSADGSFGSLSYSYDRNGNRLNLDANGVQTAYSYESTGNRLVSVGSEIISYDATGNITSLGGQTLHYSPDNRLVSVEDVADYAYNGRGQRVYKKLISNGEETNFVYDDHGRLMAETDASGAVVREHIYIGNLPVAVIYNRNGTLEIGYVHTDLLGTPRVITDTNGVVIWRWESTPFGVGGADEDPDGDGVYFVYNLRFPGQYFDEETGLHYNYFRDYDPSTGRYIESDPIGLDGGLNTFAYVTGNPLRWSDPLGLIKHISGQTIECSKNCTIRIDKVLDEQTGQVKRHLHWSCRGDEGACGEDGESSHGGTWEDAPEKVKQCARQHGFNGQNAPVPDTGQGYVPPAYVPPVIVAPPIGGGGGGGGGGFIPKMPGRRWPAFNNN